MRGKFGPFVAGVVVGGGLVWGSLTYHVLRTSDGVAIVPKLNPNFSEIYVDIRSFSASDWLEHQSLLAAIVKAKKDDILTDSATGGVRDKVDGFLQSLTRLGEQT